MTVGEVMELDRSGATELVDELRSMNEKLSRIDAAMDALQHRVESIEELREDMWPMIHGVTHAITKKLHELEQNGALGFLTEGAKMAEVVATSFDEEDVRLLGQNVVTILETVRNLTQPEVLGIADRAALALKESDAQARKKIGLFKALRDPEIRRGMTLMLGVMKELGADHAAEKNVTALVGDEEN
jgi:uncharacterized protein YjgD (DUF1641 family)